MHIQHTTPPADSKPIPDDDRYRVTRDGVVWTRLIPFGRGSIGPWRKVKIGRMRSGHLRVHFSRRDPRLVHRLVLEAFVGPCPPGMQTCHRNDVPWDNRLENLYWGTPAQNGRDRAGNLCMPRGEHHHGVVLKSSDVMAILDLHRNGVRMRAIAERFGISDDAVRGIITGKNWSHLTGIASPKGQRV